MKYRRDRTPGACYFFTLTLADRSKDYLIRHVDILRSSVKAAMHRAPFQLNGAVILPDHLHMIMTLPENDADYSQRISHLKALFYRQLPYAASRPGKRRRERGIWQHRFWEHRIRDQADYLSHLDYIHYNPVKHGYVTTPGAWPWSSLHRYIQAGILPPDWGA